MSRTPARITTNHFRVARLPSNDFYQYDGIEPDAWQNRSREIVTRLQIDHPEHFTPRIIYDGGKIAFSVKPDIPTHAFSVALNEKLKFTVRFIRTTAINLSNRDHCVKDGRVLPTVINLLQLIVRQAPAIRHLHAVRAKSFYSPEGAKDLGAGLVAWTGFFQSVRPTINKILINVDTTTTVMYKPSPLISVALEVLGSIIERNNPDVRDLERLDLDSPNGKKFARFFKKVRIKVRLPSGGKWKQEGKPISGVVTQAGHYEFRNKDDRPVTVQQYYQETYNVRVQYPRLFGVKIGKDAVFPAEFCEIVPGQFYKKMLEEAQRTELVKHSTKKPDARIRSIREAVAGRGQLFDYANSDFLRSIEMTVDTSPVRIMGQVIAPPQIVYRNPMHIKEGKWNVAGNTVLAKPADIQSWAVMVFDTRVNPGHGTVRTFVTNLYKNMQGRGLTFAPRCVPGENFPISFSNPNRWEQALDELAQRASWVDKNQARRPPNIIVVILPASAAQLKKQVKYWSTVKARISTQCVRSGRNKWEGANDQYLNNVILKINVKTGGVNSYVAITETILRNTLVVGCDVSHPPPNVDTRPSVASVVASVDSRAAFYTAAIQVQPPHVEMIQNLRDMVWAAANNYNQFHRGSQSLDHIIVFRDGVSEGEYERVAEMEIKQLEAVLTRLQEVMKRPKPKLTFIVVTKRHHVRFFPEPEVSDRTGNCPPGLVVDSELTSSNDFYLQSHGGLIGTSRPSHYTVLRNDVQWTLAQIQELCYYLCHVYASATRSVSIPAPVYYADRACARAEYHINPDKVEELDANSSVSSGAEFPIQQWAEALEPSSLSNYLYFL